MERQGEKECNNILLKVKKMPAEDWFTSGDSLARPEYGTPLDASLDYLPGAKTVAGLVNPLGWPLREE